MKNWLVSNKGQLKASDKLNFQNEEEDKVMNKWLENKKNIEESSKHFGCFHYILCPPKKLNK